MNDDHLSICTKQECQKKNKSLYLHQRLDLSFILNNSKQEYKNDLSSCCKIIA